jgi:hypothetical protein
MPRSSAEVFRMTIGVQDLTRLLMVGDPDRFGLLSCHRVVKDMDQEKLRKLCKAHENGYPRWGDFHYVDFVFTAHLSHQMLGSLEHMLLTKDHRAGRKLDEILTLAKQLTRLLCFIHAFSFLHKRASAKKFHHFQR